MMKKLLLLDAYALIYRAYYAFIKNPRYNSNGLNTSAAYGFLVTMEQILNKEKPDYIAVAFDMHQPTFRHEMYKEYKANREKMPEDIRVCIPYIRQIIEAHNIKIVEKPGFEADDIVGALAEKASNGDFVTYMVTPDKDYCQLVKDNVFLYKPARGKKETEILGVNEVNEQFQISNPKQVIDVLALWGDASDNIPGAPGIGEKTSKKIIGKYDSVENIYNHIDEFKGKQKENLINFKEQIELSKTLVTIETNIDFDFEIEDLIIKAKDDEKLKKLYEELDFRTHLVRMRPLPEENKTPKPIQNSLFDMGEPAQDGLELTSSHKTLKDVEHKYIHLNTEEKIDAFVIELSKQKEFCFDTETTHISPSFANLVAITFSFKKSEAYFIHFDDDFNKTKSILNKFQEIFANQTIRKIGQNIKYDIIVLSNYEIKVNGDLFDTMIAHHLLDSNSRNNLNHLAEHYLNYSPIEINSIVTTKTKKDFDIRTASIESLKDYACEDSDITFQLKEILAPKINEEKFEDLFYNIEMPLIHVLADMEIEGVTLNTEYLKELSVELTAELSELEAKIKELAGVEFNISSPKQLGEVLFEKLGLPAPKKTKTKQYSTSEETLKKLEEHEIIQKILRYRSLKKLISTYIDALPDLINPRTGKIHSSYNQAVTLTGRLSSNNPNLQNIPIRSEDGRKLREAFEASDDEHLFLSADYSQVELRLMAILSEDENMTNAFVNDADIHAETAAKIFKVEKEEITKEMRNTAKIANFSIIYGVSSFGLSQNINTSRKEAKQLIDNYFESYSGVKQFMDDSVKKARDKGYVETLKGRRQQLPDINSENSFVRSNAERNAINTPIQGTSADIIKIAMIEIHKQFEEKKLGSKMIMQVHDELNFDILKSEIEEVREIVKNSMENVINSKIKLKVNINEAKNWLLSH
jgi:DNA polymerase-1